MQDTASRLNLKHKTGCMAQAEKENNKSGKNPLLWVTLVVIGLIIYIFFASDRAGINSPNASVNAPENDAGVVEEGQINRETVQTPGVRARAYIHQLRAKGKPYPFDEVMSKADQFETEGSLADANLVYFFAAREGHIPAMMVMAEMSDPTMFHAENNLMDQPDAVQAFKWYKQSLDQGYEPARIRLENLHQWARAEAKFGDINAQQILLNF
jgi:TPR repeat protein